MTDRMYYFLAAFAMVMAVLYKHQMRQQEAQGYADQLNACYRRNSAPGGPTQAVGFYFGSYDSQTVEEANERLAEVDNSVNKLARDLSSCNSQSVAKLDVKEQAKASARNPAGLR